MLQMVRQSAPEEISDITATLPKNTILFLPESFEYIILCSEMFSNFDISDKLYHTEKYATGLYFFMGTILY